MWDYHLKKHKKQQKNSAARKKMDVISLGPHELKRPVESSFQCL